MGAELQLASIRENPAIWLWGPIAIRSMRDDSNVKADASSRAGLATRPERLADAELMRALCAGDKSALGKLYDRHAPTALGLATRILHDQREAEDVVHDVFLELWRRASTYRPEAASVRTWLLLMTRSRCFDRRGSAPRRLNVALSEAYDASEEMDETTPDQKRVQSFLGDLPKNHREVILLGYYEGLTSTEMAERLDVPVGTVKSRVAAALAMLREKVSS